MFKLNKMTDFNLRGKRVMIRVDFNVPMADGRITSDARIRAEIPTIEYALKQGAAIILVSHFGRPIEGQFDRKLSLEPAAMRLAELMNREVRFARNWLEGIEISSNQIVLCENVRFNVGEQKDDTQLAQRIAELCDIFVMDAFAAAHRAHASTHGVIKYAPVACAGFLLMNELEAFAKAMANPKRPMVAIVGGSKVSTKLEALRSLIQVVDQLVPGGGIANTFLAAQGYKIGKSLYEPELVATAKELMMEAEKQGVGICLPEDVVVAKEFSVTAEARTTDLHSIADDEMILDIGPLTAQQYSKWIAKAGTILWNGPVGVFEIEQFAGGTEKIARAVASSSAYSLAGGGDTIAALEKFDCVHGVSYISTGGGAFLELVEGKTLPAITALQERSSH